jgi:hypothetical protein
MFDPPLASLLPLIAGVLIVGGLLVWLYRRDDDEEES